MRLLFALALLVLALLLVAFLLLVRPAWAVTTRCTTYEEKSVSRLQNLCDNGTPATHTWNKTPSRWESTVTPPGKACMGRLDPKTRQWEGGLPLKWDIHVAGGLVGGHVRYREQAGCRCPGL